MTVATLTGTPKQIEWAERIRAQLAGRMGWKAIPDIPEARFWIDARECDTAAELERAALEYAIQRDINFESPFTELFPRYTRDDARPVIAGLRRVAESVGVVVLDLETTGLTKDDRVAEIAAVRWPTRQAVIDQVVSLPLGLAPADITGITAEEIAAAPAFDDIADDITWVASHHLVTWNIRFDLRFLLREMRRCECPPLRSRATCAMRLAGAWLELADWPTLEEAAELLKVERDGQAHRAMPDVLTTCAVLDAMAEEASRA